MGFLNKLFGTNMAKELKRVEPLVKKVEALEEEYRNLTDAQLQAKTPEFQARYRNGETLDDLLPEAFAACREAADRVLGLRPYRVQIIGGIILHQGRIAEMKTGEGKTLVATLPAYLNALSGEGVHIVTVNDYLAKRDSDWMGKVYRWMGLTVGLVIHGIDAAGKKAAYNADITYGTNNEFGFDYLRDNMAIYKAELMQRGHAFAIVDEVDSILIDEARTPLRRRRPRTSTPTTWSTKRPGPSPSPPGAWPRPRPPSTWRTSPTPPTPPSPTTSTRPSGPGAS